MDSSLILSQSEYERLLEEVKRLQARLIELTALRDDLIYHVCPSLRALYEEKIASLERELLAAQMYLREKQRILELLHAELNRRKKPSFEQAEKQAREEHKKYEKDLKKKAEEAKKFRDYWENKAKWAEHDRAEKNRQDNATGAETNHDGQKTSGTEERDQDRHQGTDKQEKTGSDESGYGEHSGDVAKQTQTPAAEMKSLYRKIVKRLHPDVHPDPTPREKELLNQAHEAYKIGDLEKMRRIWEEIIGLDPPEDRFEDSAEGRKQLRELLKVLLLRCTLLEREILRIRSEYPYTMKSFLDDENAVEERRSELKKQIGDVREMDRQLAEHIERLKKQMGGEKGV